MLPNDEIENLGLTLNVSHDFSLELSQNPPGKSFDWQNIPDIKGQVNASFSPVDFKKLIEEHSQCLIDMFFSKGKCNIDCSVSMILPAGCYEYDPSHDEAIRLTAKRVILNVPRIKTFFSTDVDCSIEIQCGRIMVESFFVNVHCTITYFEINPWTRSSMDEIYARIGSKRGEKVKIDRQLSSWDPNLWDTFPDTSLISFLKYYNENKDFIKYEYVKNSVHEYIHFTGTITDPEKALRTAVNEIAIDGDNESTIGRLATLFACLTDHRDFKFLKRSVDYNEEHSENIRGFITNFGVILNLHSPYSGDKDLLEGLRNIVYDCNAIKRFANSLAQLVKDNCNENKNFKEFIKELIMDEVRSNPLKYEKDGRIFGLKASEDIAIAAKMFLGHDLQVDTSTEDSDGDED